MRRRPWAFLATLLLLGVSAGGQETRGQKPEDRRPQAQFEEKLEVTEVLLDVLVTDRRGDVVLGLKPDDFIVREDGQPVEVTGVTFYSNRRFLPSPEQLADLGVDLRQIPEERYFILFFHDQTRANVDSPGLLGRQMEAGQQVRRWIRDEMLPNDFVAVVSYDAKLKVHQDLTRDKTALLEAVDAAVTGKRPPDQAASSSAPSGSEPALLPNLPQGKQLRKATTRLYGALEVLAEAAGEIQGRKNLVMFTTGTGLGRVSSFGLYEQDSRYYEPMVRALNDNNVAVYLLDLFRSESRHTMSDAMNQLADETGGDYYFTFTNFITPLKEISQENNGYYLLSYRSEHPAGRSGYQKVEVSTTNPRFDVRSREGYVYGDSNERRRR